jgi:hypothetical protein
MAAIDTIINDFLRDAQYRIVEIGNELDENPDFESPRYQELEQQRLELYQFMDILYIGQWNIIDGYNHLDWSDYDITLESQYLRNRCEMINSPYASFVGSYPEITACILGVSSGSGLPAGDPGDFILYNENGTPKTIPYPGFVGMADVDTVASYFS